jgi:hypothetical protein
MEGLQAEEEPRGGKQGPAPAKHPAKYFKFFFSI